MNLNRQLPMLGWLLRGRAHLVSKQFQNENHHHVFNNSFQLVEIMQPQVFMMVSVCVVQCLIHVSIATRSWWALYFPLYEVSPHNFNEVLTLCFCCYREKISMLFLNHSLTSSRYITVICM